MHVIYNRSKLYVFSLFYNDNIGLVVKNINQINFVLLSIVQNFKKYIYVLNLIILVTIVPRED